MVGISGDGGGGGGGYNYVQDAEPGDPSEGEEWYDTGADAAFVYDGSAWIEQTVVDHGQLSGIGSGDHHSRYTDSEAADAASDKLYVVRDSEFVALGVDGDADNGDLSDTKDFSPSVSGDATDQVVERTIPDHTNGFGFRLYVTGYGGELVLESIELLDSNDNTLVTDSSVSLDTFLEYRSLDNQVKTIRAVASNTNSFSRDLQLNEWEIQLKKTYVSNT